MEIFHRHLLKILKNGWLPYYTIMIIIRCYMIFTIQIKLLYILLLHKKLETNYLMKNPNCKTKQSRCT